MLKDSTKIAPTVQGINNRRAADDLPRGAVRDAVNVDFSDTGRARRRTGFVRSAAGISARSLKSIGTRAFYADGSKVFEFRPGAPRLVFDGVDPLAQVAFADWPGRGVCFSDGVVIKLITPTGVKPVAVAGVNQPLIATVTTGGSLAAGEYQVACTFLNADGEESGVLEVRLLEVGDNGKIVVTMPVAVEPETTAVRIYCSALNDSILGRLQDVPLTVSSFTIATQPVLGKTLALDPKMPLPAGDILSYRNGRMYSHLNGIAFYSDAYSGLCSPVSGYIRFPEPLSIMKETEIGTYFVADQTYYMGGEPKTSELRPLSPARGVRGTAIDLPNKRSVMWFSDRGLVVATVDGSIQFVQENNLAFGPAPAGAALYRDRDGVRQIISSIRQPAQASGEGSTWFEASISTGEVREAFQ